MYLLFYKWIMCKRGKKCAKKSYLSFNDIHNHRGLCINVKVKLTSIAGTGDKVSLLLHEQWRKACSGARAKNKSNTFNEWESKEAELHYKIETWYQSHSPNARVDNYSLFTYSVEVLASLLSIMIKSQDTLSKKTEKEKIYSIPFQRKSFPQFPHFLKLPCYTKVRARFKKNVHRELNPSLKIDKINK